MCHSNLPIGTANDSRAPWNQEDPIQVNVDIQREIYTECCGCDDFREEAGKYICGDCGQECSIYEESDEDFEKRVEEAEEKERERLEEMKYDYFY